MLENLFKLFQEQGQEAVINNPEIPNEKNNVVLADATHSVADGLQSALAGGGLQNVLSMFTGGGASGGNGIAGLLNNPIVGGIISNFTNKLTNNHGIAGNVASGIASKLIPSVLSNLVNRTNDSNDNSFDLNGIIGSLTGGTTSNAGGGGLDIGSLISQFTGGGNAGQGGGGLTDIISKITSGAQQQQQQQQNQGGGGLMDMIQGFLK